MQSEGQLWLGHLRFPAQPAACLFTLWVLIGYWWCKPMCRLGAGITLVLIFRHSVVHFTVVCLVAELLKRIKAKVNLVMIQTLLLISCWTYLLFLLHEATKSIATTWSRNQILRHNSNWNVGFVVEVWVGDKYNPLDGCYSFQVTVTPPPPLLSNLSSLYDNSPVFMYTPA